MGVTQVLQILNSRCSGHMASRKRVRVLCDELNPGEGISLVVPLKDAWSVDELADDIARRVKKQARLSSYHSRSIDYLEVIESLLTIVKHPVIENSYLT